MKVPRYCGLTRNMPMVIIALLPVLLPAWADGNGTNSPSRQLAVKVSSKNLEGPTRAIEPPAIAIKQIWAGNVAQQVQVRVVSSGDLSCTPFQLNNPNRLVLDCLRTQVQVQQASLRVDLDPVRAVRVGQFKTDVARVVIDLKRQSPYTLKTHGNAVTIVFEPISQQASGLESISEQGQPGPQPVKEKSEQGASTNAPMVPDDLPLPKYSEVASALLISAHAFPTDRLASTPLSSQPVPVVSSDRAGVQETVEVTGAAIEKLDTTPPDQDYVIGPQDLLVINVWHQPELSMSVPVRPDGKISLPLVGELKVNGLTPRLLQTLLAKELEAYVLKPHVTVIVQEVHSHKFFILGEVEHPGAYPLTTNMMVLDALATAGGFRDFAKVQQIYLLRPMPDGSRKRFRFDYKAAVNGKKAYRDIELHTGDTLVVP